MSRQQHFLCQKTPREVPFFSTALSAEKLTEEVNWKLHKVTVALASWHSRQGGQGERTLTLIKHNERKEKLKTVEISRKVGNKQNKQESGGKQRK